MNTISVSVILTICGIIQMVSTNQLEVKNKDKIVLKFINTIGKRGRGVGEFLKPKSVTIDYLGNIYVSDTGNNRIQKFDSNGNYILEFGNNDLQQVSEIKVIGSFILATDSKGGKLAKFDRTGVFLGIIYTSDNFIPNGITISPTGEIFLSDAYGKEVIVLSASGRILRRFSGWGTGEGQFLSPAGISLGKEKKRIYVADEQGGKINVFGWFGEFLFSFGNGLLQRPTAISLDDDGNIFVLDAYMGEILVFDRDGKRLNLIYDSEFLPRLKFPQGIEIKKDKIFIVDAGGDNVLVFIKVKS